jgi:hypothetical protein
MEITQYVPTIVGPTKLEQVLAYCYELSDESKEKVCIIQDIAKLGKLIGHAPMSPENFYTMYEMPVSILEAVHHNVQVEWNTAQYHNGYTPIQGQDF